MEDDQERPRPTGKPAQPVTITGTCFPWSGEQPVLLTMPGSSLLYLPLFDDPQALETIMGHYGVPYASVKRVDDAQDFLDSVVQPGLAVILNPRLTETGRLRFMQVV